MRGRSPVTRCAVQESVMVFAACVMCITDNGGRLCYSRPEKEPPHLFHHPERAAERQARPPFTLSSGVRERPDRG
jgi:hypothetical protein